MPIPSGLSINPWIHNETASRAYSVAYTNGSRARIVYITISIANAAFGFALFDVDGISQAVVSMNNNTGQIVYLSLSGIVPPGSQYILNGFGLPGVLVAWVEADL